MEKKLRFVMMKENLTVGKVAAMLDVNSAVVSHILANRNKPSYQLTGKIVSTFPKYNPYWWLGASDEIYNPAFKESEQSQNSDEVKSENSSAADSAPLSDNRASEQRSVASLAQALGSGKSSQPIERVIIVYADKSFEAYTPKE